MEKGPKIMLQIGYYYLLFLIYLHLIGCLWFFVIEETYKEWKANDETTPLPW